jgi:hypothetical protein
MTIKKDVKAQFDIKKINKNKKSTTILNSEP